MKKTPIPPDCFFFNVTMSKGNNVARVLGVRYFSN